MARTLLLWALALLLLVAAPPVGRAADDDEPEFSGHQLSASSSELAAAGSVDHRGQLLEGLDAGQDPGVAAGEEVAGGRVLLVGEGGAAAHLQGLQDSIVAAFPAGSLSRSPQCAKVGQLCRRAAEIVP